MAEAVIEIVLGSLSSLAQNEIGLFLGFDQEFEKISSLLTTIKATLEDAEEKQFTDKAIQNWLQKLKDAAHVLDDILDECATKALELKYKGFKHGLSFLSTLNPKHVAFRYKVAKKMKSIRERLDQIAEERSKFHLIETTRERRTGVPDWRQTTSTITQPQVYGRDEDVENIADFLVGPAADSDDLPVYPIVGLGGLGKTTLAQSIFNHDRVVKNFELRSWVCVSEDFSLKRMTKSIIESISGHACEDLELDPLQRKLHDLLYRKKYLLVLDDVWDEEQENWQKLKSILACGGKGASVIVTTRLSKVATIMGTMPPYELSMLSYNDCWELFKQRAFGANEEELTELVVIGKEIVQKCGGVPLATIALGSLLRFKRDKKEWLYIKESKLWSLQGENVVMPALRLSYLNLPIKLRQCFALCALFPKDYIIDKQFVIELWIANGFISSNEMLDAEDIGNDVWNELYWRSFFQDIWKDEFFGNVSFRMHDLVHDLVQSVTEDVYCITEDNGAPTSKRIRHISMCGRNTFKDVIRFPNTESLKTCITRDQFLKVRNLLPNILKCYSLRLLDYQYKDNLSSSIGHLRYLRYLNLSHGGFKTLPESLCELWNLQILKLDYCSELQNLPNNFTRLEALQHISLNGCSSLSSLPSYISKLASLRTLTMYIVGKKRGSLLAELAHLTLKGELHLKHLERVKNVTDSKEANMSRKYINHLRLSWGANEESELQENVEQIAEMLQPHGQQLQFLGVEGYRGEHFPQWMSSPSLKDLKRLELTDCKNCLYLKEESSNGGIAGGFIALENLLLNKMSKLISFSRDQVAENMFTCLSKLKIIGCPNLLGLPFLPALKELSVKGNCSWELLSSIHKLHNLESLYLGHNEEVSCFPDNMLSNLTSLKELMIRNHSKLKLLPIETINPCVLWRLSIENCENLESLKDEALQGLHSLEHLEIQRCPKFNLSAGFGYLTCLKELRIGNISDMSGFSEALQHMTALEFISLSELPNLTSLPDCLGNLGLLRELSIAGCPNLMCLPTTIQCLSGLQTLHINGCHPELANRCEKETGEDWPKIAHVKYLYICK
ncbi:putative disease resistance protein RGA4 [Trifolium pratense]|uniref:putative disease resistance protein RGA4 n=1 Tax=Trifolium pratense TaxID=57577 RepID=UPI001E690ECD|nr:putative disease resistance protein RGA4 [Trifolium pratense]